MAMGFSRQEYWSGLPFFHPHLLSVSCITGGFFFFLQLSHWGSLHIYIYILMSLQERRERESLYEREHHAQVPLLFQRGMESLVLIMTF